MNPPPCPTCRHYVLQLDILGRRIRDLRIAATRRHGLHGRLMHHIAVGRRIRAKRDACRDQHRAAISGLADHLPEHAERSAA